MAKVLGLLGSPRKYGNDDVLTQLCLETVNKAGLDVELIRLHELNIKNCKGCLSCVYKGKCSQDDDMTALLEKLVSASGLVIAAPTYIFSPSAIIKTLIDRCLMLTPYLEGLLDKEKYAVSINIAGNAKWNTLGAAITNQCAMAYGFKIIDQMAAYGPGPAEVIVQEDAVKRAVLLGEKLARAVQGQEPAEKPEMTGQQCPICKSTVFDFKQGGRVQCAVCLAEGNLVRSAEGFGISFAANEHNFFYIEDRIEHVKDWIEPSKDRFFGIRDQIKTRLEELGIKKR